MVLSAERDMAVMLPAITRAIPMIFGTQDSMFLTATAKDILFDGVLINCTLKDFTAKALCMLMKTQGKDFQKVGKNAFKFSFFGVKNGTLQERLRLKRGIQNVADVGRVVAYKEQPRMSVWSGPKCNEFSGTDGSIFPPFLQDGVSVRAYAPDLSLNARYVGPTVYKGIKGNIYSADFGDMSNNPDLKCFCTTPKSCLKRGVHDLTRCTGAPLAVSLPHFFRAHEDYLNEVTGLYPEQARHETTLHFEPLTGTPMLGYKRLQFNIILRKVSKFTPMKNLHAMIFPILWVDEGLELDDKYVSQLKSIFVIISIINIFKWITIVVGGILVATGLFILIQKLTISAILALGRKSPEVSPRDIETPLRY
ncbi:hypothetical protein B7P43_G03985 [Cryptotermes secundus]|uniref:Sensory neuron membrane protein 1 n=1 Tax=Cryptotermes secundus TaxID=105785 RepID=A0A2J7RCN4_9NEOP|nr:hypothetical protein B7P43_G03985 [Cryptotermes secundus]